MRRRTLVPPTPARRGLAVLVATCVVTLGLLGSMSVARAHDGLVGSSPSADATLDAAPTEIELRFSGEIQELGTQVAVTASDGTPVGDGPLQVDGTGVVQPVTPDLRAGDYTVEWRATSADGHPLSDEFAFTVGGGAATVVGEAAAMSSTDSSSGRWIGGGAAVVLLVAVLVAVRQLRRRS